ncbi:MAG: rRNA maturation RNase YbeY [Lachnospiraceae bacterium]|nr:rRNA maturation RNase YbeY [Robinsoniella sp.]MDY3765413.1 rRNA maturation RNase YbeY [Lachnospiraceae bacterium]
MTVNFEKECETSFDFAEEEVARLVIEKALDYEECPYEAEVNLLITDNEGIHEMNREHRGIDRPTDVLSFPSLTYEKAGDFDFLEREEEIYNFHPETGELMLGDIVISRDKVAEQAESYGHSQKREYAFLIAHSMLHLMGYDHMTEEEAKVMEKKQKEILEQLGISR